MFVVGLTLLLLISSLAGATAAWFLREIQIENNFGNTIYFFAISFSLRDVTFNVSHQLLAWKYYKVAKDSIQLMK
jgi:hypothetical protein